MQLPLEASSFIDQLERDFCLERKNEPGLSVVVPFFDPDWTTDQVAHYLTEDYFYPILNHELVVTVEGPGSELVISADSIANVVTTFTPLQQSHTAPLLELATWGMRKQVEDLALLNPVEQNSSLKWSKRFIPEDLVEEIRERYSKYRKIGLRVPVPVRQKGRDEQVSYFDVFMEKADGSHLKRPLFIREGILISEVRCKLTRDMRAIVCIEDAPLARMLGDAENPAHTDWSDSSSHFKGKYINGLSTLRFIRNSVAEICQFLAQDPGEEDPRLLLDVFSIGADEHKDGFLVDYEMLKSAQDKAHTTVPRELSGPSRPKPFRVRRRKGGADLFR